MTDIYTLNSVSFGIILFENFQIKWHCNLQAPATIFARKFEWNKDNNNIFLGKENKNIKSFNCNYIISIR